MICVCCVMIKEKSIESLQLESQRWAFFNGIQWTGGWDFYNECYVVDKKISKTAEKINNETVFLCDTCKKNILPSLVTS